MTRRLITVLCSAFLLSVSSDSFAQSGPSGDDLRYLQAVEDSLLQVADSMFVSAIPDERFEYCEKFVRQFVRALKTPNSFSYPFTKLQEKVNIVYPEDRSFRIFNWAIAPNEVMRRYFGAVQMAGDQLKLYPLMDRAPEIGKAAEDSILSNTRWFGALYYRIITHEVDGEKIYTLFGVNSGSPSSNKKLMDPMRITETGLVFGAPIFNVSSENNAQQRVQRFIIEYKKEVQASMNWDEELKAVFFDKLVSGTNDPTRKYTYVPSGQYDGFRWENNQWTYVQDLIPIQTFKDGEAPAPAPVKAKE